MTIMLPSTNANRKEVPTMFLKELPSGKEVPSYMRVLDDQENNVHLLFAEDLAGKVNGGLLAAIIRIKKGRKKISFHSNIENVTFGLNKAVAVTTTGGKNFHLRRCDFFPDKLTVENREGSFSFQV